VDLATAILHAIADRPLTNAKLVTSLQEAASQLQAVYAFSGFLPPLDKATFSLGATIPVKFALTDGSGRAVTTAVAQLSVSQLRPDGTLVSVDVIPRGGTNQANLFRSDAVYVYNLSTMNLAAGNYVLRVLLDNGTNYAIKIALQ
jgi:hypothetical protein